MVCSISEQAKVSRAKSKSYYIDLTGTRIKVRSSYEAIFGTYCTSKGIEVAYEPDVLTIKMNGKIRRYTPDFKTPFGYVELKGKPNPDQLVKIRKMQKIHNIRLMHWADIMTYIGLDGMTYMKLRAHATAADMPYADFIGTGAFLKLAAA
jgi:hypothetical protein